MNTKQIEMLLMLSETLNFTKAANNLYITQPSLTYQIKVCEDEVRFKIFNRDQKNVTLTPAGKCFIENLRKIKSSYDKALEESLNYSDKYNDDITISLPYRSAISVLPKAIIKMEEIHKNTLITPIFGWDNRLNEFINGNVDIIFDDYEQLKNINGIKIVHLYESHIYLICNKDDQLASKKLIRMNDLKNQTLMIGGGSQRNLKIVQNKVLDNIHIPFFNSNDHDTTLTNIAAKKAIVLAPSFLHDPNDGFAWIPFDCKETIDCCLAIKDNDNRKCITDFIQIIIGLYKSNKFNL